MDDPPPEVVAEFEAALEKEADELLAEYVAAFEAEGNNGGSE